ncbi:hypothetical protein MOBT1_001351 [Malassezia obtusa]|uniref:Uncharacterized protein n=1 Tax=Malassezia obtusa TaxID=76774 RepID=A0AAF0E168_9BASI|nr:hypothetical protein MOBT1_001351 [Malassezia obtusa]
MPAPRKRTTPGGSDTAYQSLRRLLLSAPANANHLEAMDRNALYGSIGFYLSAMALPNVKEFTQAIATSPSLWTPPTRADAAHIFVTRATSLVQALLFAVDERILLILDNMRQRSPQLAARELSKWVHTILEGLENAINTYGVRSTTLLPRLAMLTGLLRGVEAARYERKQSQTQQKHTPLQLRRLSAVLQKQWSNCCAELLHTANEEEQSRAVRGARLAAVAMAAQCVDLLPESQMRLVDDGVWIEAALPALLDIFGCAESTACLDGLFDSVIRGPEGIEVPEHASCVQWSTAVEAHPLFSLAGPVSRLLASALQRHCMAQGPLKVEDELGDSGTRLLPSLHRIATKLDDAWCASPLAGAETEAIEQTSRTRTKTLWQVFKTLLFAVTMTLDAVVNAVVERCPSPSETYRPARNAESKTGYPPMATSNTPVPYLHVITDVIHIYLPLYFITSQFGLDGFESYRKVFYSALDVLSRDPEGCTQLTAALAASVLGGVSPRALTAQSATYAQRMHTTYFLLVVEQLVGEVPEAMIDHLILPICRPYLEDTSFQDAFESAHSVILALFSAQSPCTLELTPFYVQLLLRTFPSQLNAAQLNTALSTVVASLSDRSDSLAWWCIEQVEREIATARLTRESDERTQALTRCLASLISHVNLVLLRSLLNKVSAQIFALPEGSPARSELVEATFDALGDMNASTREEAMRWWLEKSPGFTRGMPADA